MKIKMLFNEMSKVVYVTSNQIGTVAVHEFGETFDFESELHEMRLCELIYNAEESLFITSEEITMLWLIEDDKKGENTMFAHRSDVLFRANSSGRSCTLVEFPGYSNSLYEQVSYQIKPGILSDFREFLRRDKNNPFPITRFNAVDDLRKKINHFLQFSSPRWGKDDTAPSLAGNEIIRIVPGEIFVSGKRRIFLIPIFGPQIRKILNLPNINTNDFNSQVTNFLQAKIFVISGGVIDKEPFFDHFYIMRCNLCQNTDGYPDESGTIFAWMKEPANSAKIRHIKNESDCWIPVKKQKFESMQIIIRNSYNVPAVFKDDYTLAVFEFRPRAWKEQST